MYAFKHYDPTTYSIIFNGIPLSDFAKGTFIEIEYDCEGFRDEVGTDGHVVRYRLHDQRAKVTVTHMSSSPTNSLLSAMYNSDLKSPNGIGVGPILVRDSQGLTVFAGAHAWVQGMPNWSLGDEIGEIKWVIRVAKLEAVVG